MSYLQSLEGHRHLWTFRVWIFPGGMWSFSIEGLYWLGTESRTNNIHRQRWNNKIKIKDSPACRYRRLQLWNCAWQKIKVFFFLSSFFTVRAVSFFFSWAFNGYPPRLRMIGVVVVKKVCTFREIYRQFYSSCRQLYSSGWSKSCLFKFRWRQEDEKNPILRKVKNWRARAETEKLVVYKPHKTQMKQIARFPFVNTLLSVYFNNNLLLFKL